MKIAAAVGARPQFIKASVVSREVRRRNAASAGPLTEEIVVLPVHPRTGKQIKAAGLEKTMAPLKTVEPFSFLDMARLEQSAKAIFTDSGGVQKEAFIYQVPCLTLRDETEWVETLDGGYNRLCGADKDRILSAWKEMETFNGGPVKLPYGDGRASKNILDSILSFNKAKL